MPDNDWMRFIIFLVVIFSVVAALSMTFTFIENIKKAKDVIRDAEEAGKRTGKESDDAEDNSENGGEVRR